jgi:hypothetical protein
MSIVHDADADGGTRTALREGIIVGTNSGEHMTQQPDQFTAGWNEWFTASFDRHWKPIKSKLEETLNEVLEEAFGNAGKDLEVLDTVAGRHAQKIYELLEIVQVLAVGNDFLRGRVDQVTREFERQNGIEHKQASRTVQQKTIATTTEEQRSSTISQTLSIIDEVLNA